MDVDNQNVFLYGFCDLNCIIYIYHGNLFKIITWRKIIIYYIMKLQKS